MVETLKIEHLSKTFPGQAALIDVDLEIAAGEVHALVGQNGSGKSTLIKVLAGYHQPDSGSSAWIEGQPLTLGDGHAAAAAGVRFVHQDLGLVGSISTIENLALTAGYRTGWDHRIHWKKEATLARKAMHDLGLQDVDVKAPVSDLSAAEKTGVAIARALIGWEKGVSLLVLDEPTATLPGQDVTRLFEVIARLKATGISILYVSHHLDEVFALADTVTVLRDARRIATVPVSGLNHGSLIELIVGHRLEDTSASTMTRSDSPLLRVAGLAGGNVDHLDLDVHPGEIVGLAGITGSGREHVLALISGQITRDDGQVHVGEREVSDHPADALESGMAFVTADRAVRGVVGTMCVRENLTLCDLSPYVIAGRLRQAPERKDTRSWIERLSIKTYSSEALIGSLSGGNQQKVMFSKALRLTPKVLLLDEPTQGIDVGAKDQIHSLVDEAAADGVAVVVSSTDTDELVRLCHRVVVLVDGRAVAQLHGDKITAQSIEHIQLQTSQRMS